MKTLQRLFFLFAATFAIHASEATSAPSDQSQSAASADQPLTLDLSRFQERFVTGNKTNAAWRSLVGRQTFDGLPFQIDGRGCVSGSKVGERPDLIGIQVGRRFDELHLLHVTQWADAEGRTIALIRLNYADGGKVEIPILFGGHVRDWHRMPSEEKELLSDPTTKVIWRGAGVERIKSTGRLFKSMLPNPHPEKIVATLDVVSTHQVASYDLIAATVANRDPSRPVTPPVPSTGPERHFDGRLIVRVVEAGSTNPIAGALIDPYMHVDDTWVIGIPVYTSATGEGILRYPVDSATQINVSVEKEGWSSINTRADLESGETNTLKIELQTMPKVAGVARDTSGAALPKVELTLWPEWRAQKRGLVTKADGRYELTWNQNNGDSEAPWLVARDLAHNLAAAVELDGEATNLDLTLEPALTIRGRALDPQGKPLAKAEVFLMFWSEHGNRRSAASFGKPVKVDTAGWFEIKTMPAGRHYSVNFSAKGFGTASRNILAQESETKVELEPCELPIANQRIAGVVLDENKEPVVGASLYTYGNNQPNLNGQTDAKGHFTLEPVCAGLIHVSANAARGRWVQVEAQGGDTNIIMQLGTSPNSGRSAPPLVSLKGKALPDLAPLGLTSADCPSGQPVLVAIIDVEQRPSRRLVRLLAEQAATLKEKGLAVVIIQSGSMSEEALAAWKKEAAVPFPVGAATGAKAEQTRTTWGATALPWLVLTDKTRTVVAEGFSPDELDAKVQGLGK